MKGFLSYIVSEEGQQAAADQAGSAPLDSALADEAAGIIDGIKSRRRVTAGSVMRRVGHRSARRSAVSEPRAATRRRPGAA